jgi:uncharacterized protein
MIATAPHARGIVVPILAQPGAKRAGIIGERAGALRAAIQSVLALALGCKANQITLLSGESSRRKRFLIDGINADELTRRLAPFMLESPSPHSKG